MLPANTSTNPPSDQEFAFKTCANGVTEIKRHRECVAPGLADRRCQDLVINQNPSVTWGTLLNTVAAVSASFSLRNAASLLRRGQFIPHPLLRLPLLNRHGSPHLANPESPCPHHPISSRQSLFQTHAMRTDG